MLESNISSLWIFAVSTDCHFFSTCVHHPVIIPLLLTFTLPIRIRTNPWMYRSINWNVYFWDEKIHFYNMIGKEIGSQKEDESWVNKFIVITFFIRFLCWLWWQGMMMVITIDGEGLPYQIDSTIICYYHTTDTGWERERIEEEMILVFKLNLMKVYSPSSSFPSPGLFLAKRIW